jgi:hypothetical protein
MLHPSIHAAAGPMKNRKSEPGLPDIDPSHPNYDAILLKRARLQQHRRRRAENSGALAPKSPGGPSKASGKRAAKKAPRR